MTAFDDIAPQLAAQAIELPSWAFGNSGTRFKVFAQPGVPQDPFEKVADAPRFCRRKKIWKASNKPSSDIGKEFQSPKPNSKNL